MIKKINNALSIKTFKRISPAAALILALLLPISAQGEGAVVTPQDKAASHLSKTEIMVAQNDGPVEKTEVEAGNDTEPDSEVEGGHVNVWPLFYYSDDKAEGSLTLSIITPLFYYRKTDAGTKEFGFRPLFYYHRDDKKDTTVVDFIYPIGKYKQRGDDKNFRIFPILRDARHDLADDKERIAHDYFPLFWGRSEDDELYGGLFPFYGTIKDRFGRDDMLFVMWPLYYRTVEEGFTSNNYLWPLVRTTEGEGGWGARFFPIWGHEEITGEEYSTFYLLPLVSFRGRYLDTENPLMDTSIIPLYSTQWTPHSRTTTIIWPLFTYAYDTNFNYKKYDLPWPFLRIARSDVLDVTEFAPIFKYQTRTEGEATEISRYLMYPVFKDIHLTSPTKTMDTYRFMLINKYIKTDYTEGEDELWIYLFPFYNSRSYKSGLEESTALYPLPLYDDSFKRNYLPLFEFYNKGLDDEGVETIKIMHHLYIKKITDDWEYIDAPFYHKKRAR
ncbi:MAG: hypothetical protein JW984_01210 [Deltaproteobacteria bacterium]|uniref:Uncharacterized protein n=1 Tax=Candidatus Zymogenus saltonus TaxID=2844893 RepID=A0A9D8KC04_9DELT|nr:hypothetical protein [Candidatus Zymogenus saltonus]